MPENPRFKSKTSHFPGQNQKYLNLNFTTATRNNQFNQFDVLFFVFSASNNLDLKHYIG